MGLETVKLLLAKGADIDARNSNGRTPLSEAIWGGHRETAQLLLAEGAAVDTPYNWGRTPLSYCTDWRVGLDTVWMMLAKGADVNAVDQEGRTPLSYVAESGVNGIMQLLQARQGETRSIS